MGNGCFILNVNKICSKNTTNEAAEILENVEIKEEKKSQSNNDVTNIVYINQKNKKEINKINNTENNNNSSIKYKINSNLKMGETIKSETFTNFIQELDMAFMPNKVSEQFKVYDMNYIKIDKNYNEKMLDIINGLRNEPKNFIQDLDILFNKNNEENKILIENDETHENIIFNDINQEINETKNFLKKAKKLNTTFNLNQNLYFEINKTFKNSDMSLEQKVTKIIVSKKKEFVKKYPKIQFFVNFIKDAKIGIIYLLMKNNKISYFRNVLFDDKYKEFNVSWFKDKKNIFISFLCFA